MIPSEFTPRTRTITWYDPLLALERGREMSGLEFLNAIIRGDLPIPPSSALLGIQPLSAEHGRVVMRLEPAEYLYNPVGVVQGGLISTLLDAVMGCAVASVMAAGEGYTTLEIKVNFVRPLRASAGPVEGEGTIIHAGGRVATAEGRVTDRSGQLYAHGVTTCLVSRGTRPDPAA
jgi:uncharacterized protein (TIGR00369 family)